MDIDAATAARTAVVADNNLNLRRALAYEAEVVEHESAIGTKSMPKSRREITVLAIERMRQTAMNGWDPARQKGRFGKELDGLCSASPNPLLWVRRRTYFTAISQEMRALYVENLALREALAYESRVVEAQSGLTDGSKFPARRREQITAVVARMREAAVTGQYRFTGKVDVVQAHGRLLAERATATVVS